MDPGVEEEQDTQPAGVASPFGVTFDAKRRRWKARIHFAGAERYIGRYKTSRDAALAYDQVARVVNRWLHQTPGLGATELKKRTRQLNFPALSPNDSAVKRRLHSILAESLPASQCSKFLSQGDDTYQQADQVGPAGSPHTACASSAGSAPLPSLFGAHMGSGLGAGQQCSGQLPSFQSTAASNHSAAAAAGPAAPAAESELGGGSPGAVSVAVAATGPVQGIWGQRIQSWVNARHNHAQLPAVMGLGVALPTPTLAPGGSGAAALVHTASAAADIAGGAAAAGLVGALCRPAAVPSAFAAASGAAASDALVLDARQAANMLLPEQQEQPASAPVVPTATALGTATRQQQHGSGGAATAALSEGRGAGCAATAALDMLDAQDVDSLMAFFAEEGDLSLTIDSLQLPELPLLPATQHAAEPQEQQGLLTSGQGQQQPATALDTAGTSRCDLISSSSAAGACGAAHTFMHGAPARQSSAPQQCQHQQQQLGQHTGSTIARTISLSALHTGDSSSMTGLDISAAAQRAGLLRASLSPPPQQLQQPVGLVTWPQPQDACQTGRPRPLQFQPQHRPASLQLPELLPLSSCCPTVTHLTAAAAGSQSQQQCAGRVEPFSSGLGPTSLAMMAPMPASPAPAAPPAPAEGTAARQARAAHTASSVQQAGIGDAVAAGSGADADIGAGCGAGAGAGLFDCITTQEQMLAVIRACMHVLTDLELYLLQQPHTVSAVGAMLDYMHAAWHSEVARSGAVSATAGAAAIAAAAAEAKAAPPSAHAPRHMSLLMLGKVVQLTADLLSGGAADVGQQRRVSLGVVVELQQGFTDVQRKVAGGKQVRVKDGLQAWASGNLMARGGSAVTGDILWLIGQL